jgi:hypothetical protein
MLSSRSAVSRSKLLRAVSAERAVISHGQQDRQRQDSPSSLLVSPSSLSERRHASAGAPVKTSTGKCLSRSHDACPRTKG